MKMILITAVVWGASGAALADDRPPGASPEAAGTRGNEVIEVHGQQLPIRYAKPKTDVLKIPPYSDKAVLGDYWSKAWLLLDVDERGVVARVKFLKRPGHDLDDIAVKYAFELTFDPARDHNGVPTRSYIVWPLEWPSVGWLQSRQLLPNRLPNFAEVVQLPHGIVFDMLPPCAEGQGLNQGMIHLSQRDCSVPDLSTSDASEPWLVRDPSVPPPAVAAARSIDPAKERADRIASARQNRTYAIVTTATTAAAVVGLIVSYRQFRTYSDRADADMISLVPAPGRIEADQQRMRNWQMGMIGFAAGTMLSGIATGYFWSHASHVALQPDADGAVLTYKAPF
jgi:hypothetical protein